MPEDPWAPVSLRASNAGHGSLAAPIVSSHLRRDECLGRRIWGDGPASAESLAPHFVLKGSWVSACGPSQQQEHLAASPNPARKCFGSKKCT